MDESNIRFDRYSCEQLSDYIMLDSRRYDNNVRGD